MDGMELSPLLIYESFLLAIGVAAVFAFALFYFRLLKGYNALHTDHDRMAKELDEYGNLVTASAKQHIERLVTHSNELSDELKAELSKLLQAQAAKETGAYEAVVRDVGKELEKESKLQVQEFATSLSKEVTESETEIRGKISKLYDDARAEVAKLHADADAEILRKKEQAMGELRSNIYAIVEAVVRQSTGRLLSKQDHEGIILDELEQGLRSTGMGQS